VLHHRGVVPFSRFGAFDEFPPPSLKMQLKVGSLELDECGEVSFKTAAEFGGVDDITPVLASFMETHSSLALDCFRALEDIKDRDASSGDALKFISREGNSSEGVGESVSSMLNILAD